MPVTSTRSRPGLAALVALLITGTAVAHEKATGVVAARMNAMKDSAAQAKALDRALKASSPNVADVRARAERIHAHAHDMMRMFPPGSDHGHTFAAPEIWTKRDEFERLTQSYDAATEQLVEAAHMDAVPDLRARFDAVRRQCLGCHERFRTPGAE
jgi:cytochrome c556